MKRINMLGIALVMLLSQARYTFAAVEDSELFDGRLEAYGKGILQGQTTALSLLLLVGLGILCVGVLFKDAHRTHLD